MRLLPIALELVLYANIFYDTVKASWPDQSHNKRPETRRKGMEEGSDVLGAIITRYT